MTINHRLFIASAAAVAFAAMTTIAAAQPADLGWGGPGVMGPSMYSRICSPGAAGFAEWHTGRMERLVKLTAAQRGKLDELRVASRKALDEMRSACPTQFPGTAIGRMAAMEKRLDAMLAAVKTMRPAVEAFYATLNDEQKTRLDTSEGTGRFWRWYDRRG